MSKTVGIVAEYNPFHRGHQHQIEQIRARHENAAIIAVLSSSFLQRGVPALTDKWTRAQTAVQCGADLVLELPIPFCCANAGTFATGAVQLLKATGAVDALSFGMENADGMNGAIPAILVQEPPAFKTGLQKFLQKGYSYAQARAEAADICCPGAAALLSRPNNTLAFAYAEAVLRENAGFELIPIQRTGSGYHDTASGDMMSAAGVRQALARGSLSVLDAIPQASARAVQTALVQGRCLLDDAPLWSALRLLLMRSRADDLARYAEISEGIENRFLSQYAACSSWSEFVDRTATRRYPRTRVQRQMISLLLNVTHEESREYQARGPAYIRPLAMNRRGRQLLRRISADAALPVITKPASLKGNAYAQRIMSLEFRAAAIWESLVPHPNWRRELTAVPAYVE